MRRRIADRYLGFTPGITAHFLDRHCFGFKRIAHDGGVSPRGLQRLIDEEALEGRMPGTRDASVISTAAPVGVAAWAIDARDGEGYR